MSLEDIYSDLILELARNPLNKFLMKDSDVSHKDSNLYCGDTMEIFLKIKNKKIEKASFDGEGCAISLASASILMKLCKNKTIKEGLKIGIEDILSNLNIEDLKNNPVRIKCATLPLKIFKLALLKYSEKIQANFK